MAIEQKQGMKVAGPPAGGPPTTDANIQRTRNYIQETLTELKKTTWPTREEATRLTLVVVGVIFVLGCYMGLLDFVLTALVNKFSLIK